jgi:hypothetical protein
MNNKERAMAVLRYQQYDRLPIVHFGFWDETLVKWAHEGHITMEQATHWTDSTPIDKQIGDKLGFDFGWFNCFNPDIFLSPLFESKVLKVHEDGSREFLQADGVVVVQKDDVRSIPAEIDHLLKDRRSWQEHYLPKLQFFEQRVTNAMVNTGKEFIKFDQGGLDYLKDESRSVPVGLFCGSLFGRIRDVLGVVGISYLVFDDEALYDEIIDTVATLCYRCTEYTLAQGAKFDFAHFWEDICFKNGPLVMPDVFYKKVGPYYKKITDLVHRYGIDIVSLDCDGLIDALIPTWLENGVNTMFPIEVGTWRASIAPWRKQYGQELRGVGGMDKVVFAYDYAAIDNEVERLKPLVELGGFIPCPDHRIAPDAKWENVQYYCEKMRKTFAK